VNLSVNLSTGAISTNEEELLSFAAPGALATPYLQGVRFLKTKSNASGSADNTAHDPTRRRNLKYR
jgi:hypothetical protein